MKIMQNITELLTGTKFADALIEQMLVHIDDFADHHNLFLSAVNTLTSQHGNQMEKVVSALHKRTALILLFSGALGIRMNWDHFVNPMTPNCTWRQVDYNDYLREDLSHNLPEYQQADAFLTVFQSSLTTQQQEIYAVILEYETYLQTVGPKLAHYYGYLLGNILLPKLIPGYQEDAVLTIKYNDMLADYFGKPFLPISLTDESPLL